MLQSDVSYWKLKKKNLLGKMYKKNYKNSNYSINF